MAETIRLAPAHGVDWYDVELCHRQSGGHWFDPESMRFFRSRRCDVPHLSKDRRVVVAVSSEAFEMSDGSQPYGRKYTVRVFDWARGSFVRDPWGFQAFKGRVAAVRAAQRFLAAYDASGLDLDAGEGVLHSWIAAQFPEVSS